MKTLPALALALAAAAMVGIGVYAALGAVLTALATFPGARPWDVGGMVGGALGAFAAVAALLTFGALRPLRWRPSHAALAAAIAAALTGSGVFAAFGVVFTAMARSTGPGSWDVTGLVFLSIACVSVAAALLTFAVVRPRPPPAPLAAA